jgi:hypothetical protein
VATPKGVNAVNTVNRPVDGWALLGLTLVWPVSDTGG